VRIIKILILAFVVAIPFSCTTQRDIVYFQNSTGDTTMLSMSAIPPYKLQQKDILYVRVFSLSTQVSDLFNTSTSTLSQNQFVTESGLYIYGYTVNDSGYIELPITGSVKVAGLTMDEASRQIQNRVKEYFKDATTIVKLLSYKYSVLGEVTRPGMYQNYTSNLTVLEALSSAGDINQYGNRRRIMVIRSSPTGTKSYRIDLTNNNAIASEGYYLLPHDVVYVEPIKNKAFQLNIPNISIWLSTLSTTLLLLNYLAK